MKVIFLPWLKRLWVKLNKCFTVKLTEKSLTNGRKDTISSYAKYNYYG